MADIVLNKTKLEPRIAFTVSEGEARALDAVVGYGFDGFIKAFKKHMGESYIRGYEEHLEIFFETIRGSIPGILRRIDESRKVFDGNERSVSPTVLKKLQEQASDGKSFALWVSNDLAALAAESPELAEKLAALRDRAEVIAKGDWES